ncbi:MAG TPA: cyclic lactone autoinducer peptide [Bacillota bacterium]|nr:cyclic lactone autoinducer peptide [Bacillota bacterium]
MKKFYFLLASLVLMVVALSSSFACFGYGYEPKMR